MRSWRWAPGRAPVAPSASPPWKRRLCSASDAGHRITRGAGSIPGSARCLRAVAGAGYGPDVGRGVDFRSLRRRPRQSLVEIMVALKMPERSVNVDAKAFEILVRLHHRRLIAYALSLTRREDVAEDLVQDAFLVAYRDLAKFDPTRDFAAWVRGIVRMKYLEWTRSSRTQAIDGAVIDSIEERHRTWDRAV